MDAAKCPELKAELSGQERPAVVIVRYFDGNDDEASIGCNLLELRSRNGDPVIALSAAAREKLRPDQLRALEGFGELVDAPIPTIEAVGGGSVRCMIAEIHLPRSSSLRGA